MSTFSPMRASDLVTRLQSLIAEHGDLPVVFLEPDYVDDEGDEWVGAEHDVVDVGRYVDSFLLADVNDTFLIREPEDA